jgi:hypothetical protein
MTHERPENCDLVVEESERVVREQRNADEATAPEEERAALRRADKAAYLRDKLLDQQESDGDFVSVDENGAGRRPRDPEEGLA